MEPKDTTSKKEPPRLVIRDLASEVRGTITQMFAGLPDRGRNAPGASWTRAAIYIAILYPALGADAARVAFSLWISALQMAHSRNEVWLRDLDRLRAKFIEEHGEFAQARAFYAQGKLTRVELMGRMANIIYYSTQIYSQSGEISVYKQQCSQAAAEAGVPLEVAWRIACAKMERRGRRAERGLSIDRLAEERAMQFVLDEYEHDAASFGEFDGMR